MQRRRGLAIGVVVALASVLVLGLVGGAIAGKKKKVVKVSAAMTGSEEVPPADPDGSGTADFKLKAKKKKVCFDIEFQGIDTPNLAHIHEGGAGVAGPPVVTLFETAQVSPTKACVGAEQGATKSLIKEIGKHPKQYYVNLHNDPFDGGAIRGQLKKGNSSSSGGGGGGGGNTGGGSPGY